MPSSYSSTSNNNNSNNFGNCCHTSEIQLSIDTLSTITTFLLSAYLYTVRLRRQQLKKYHKSKDDDDDDDDDDNKKKDATATAAAAARDNLKGDDDDDDGDDDDDDDNDRLYDDGNIINHSSFEEVLTLRRRYFGSNVSISYSNSDPLMIVEGRGAHLRSSRGIWYLDTRNNVAHCGHCHPTITQTISSQLVQINTNTRYLHPNTSRLASKLASLCPSPLEICFLVNSGSEANDLALRLALAWKQQQNGGGSSSSSSVGGGGGGGRFVVVEGGYHGHTMATLGVSPYKFQKSRENYLSNGNDVITVPFPDTFRKSNIENPAEYYAGFVERACRRWENDVTAMIIEGGMSVAGVIIPPPGYLTRCATAIRQAGGLYIADEVQTGLGRFGRCFWAFQYHDDRGDDDDDVVVTPDILTLGKPFGNGMPLAAVVTTRAIADNFADMGVEYFNTFGGNTVCSAAGLAVLDVLEREGLQENARRVGEYLMERLWYLRQRQTSSSRRRDDDVIIGDVRGSGLFIGVEFVKDATSLEPATLETSFLCTHLKNKYRILTSIDGIYDNVLVIKPPMCFSEENVDQFVKCLDLALEDWRRLSDDDKKNMTNTPT